MTRILVADDHPMIRTALEALLRDTEFEIIGTAGTGEATLREVERLAPDILLLDLQMPGGNGMDVLRRVRAAKAKAPLKVILLTAAIDDSALLEAKSMKVRGIVLKNSDPVFLLDCLDQGPSPSTSLGISQDRSPQLPYFVPITHRPPLISAVSLLQENCSPRAAPCN